jgi:F-type H+-transporting ATPase subunit epsilon
MAAITVNILTPDRQVLQAEADSVVVPAYNGELGILSHHAPLVAELQPGQIRMRTGADTQFFAVSGGYVQVKDNHVVVLAETAEMAHEIDVERAKQAAERAKAELRAPTTQAADLANVEAALRRALARLRAAEELRRHHSTSASAHR